MNVTALDATDGVSIQGAIAVFFVPVHPPDIAGFCNRSCFKRIDVIRLVMHLSNEPLPRPAMSFQVSVVPTVGPESHFDWHCNYEVFSDPRTVSDRLPYEIY